MKSCAKKLSVYVGMPFTDCSVFLHTLGCGSSSCGGRCGSTDESFCSVNSSPVIFSLWNNSWRVVTSENSTMLFPLH